MKTPFSQKRFDPPDILAVNELLFEPRRKSLFHDQPASDIDVSILKKTTGYTLSYSIFYLLDK